jgi:hypothetical protein
MHRPGGGHEWQEGVVNSFVQNVSRRVFIYELFSLLHIG